MSEVDEAKFSCDGCGKTYKWKPEFAGRKVKCKCGFVMTAPTEPLAPPAEDEPDMDALYSLADAGHQAAKSGAVEQAIRCPSCRSQLDPGAAVCPQCGFNLKTGGKANAPKAGAAAPAGGGGAAVAVAAKRPSAGAFAAFPPPSAGLQQEEAKENPVMDVYVPVGLLALGVLGTFANYMFFGEINYNFVGAAPRVAADLVINVVLLAIGCMVAIRLIDVAFGSPGMALVKVSAIAIAPVAAAGFASWIISGSFGMYAAWVVSMAAFFGLFKLLFDFELSESMLLSCFVFFIKIFAVPFILGVLGLGLIASATSGGKVTVNDDKIVVEIQEMSHTEDAAAWLKDSANHMFGSLGHEMSLKMCDEMVALGCTQIDAVTVRGEGDTTTVFCKLPKGADKRKAVFDWFAKIATEKKLDAPKDNGQKYFLMNFPQNITVRGGFH